MWTLFPTSWTEVGIPYRRASSTAEPALGRVEEATEVGRALLAARIDVGGGTGETADGPVPPALAQAVAAAAGLCLTRLAGGWDEPGDDFWRTGLIVRRRSVPSRRNWPLGKKLRKDFPSESVENEITSVVSLCCLTNFGIIGGATRSSIALTWSSASGVVDSTRSRYPRPRRDEEPAEPDPFGRDEINSSKSKGREDVFCTVPGSTVTVGDDSDMFLGTKEDIFDRRFRRR
jgi:hypothetical protein